MKLFHLISAEFIEETIQENLTSFPQMIKQTYIDHYNGLSICPESTFLWVSKEDKFRIIALPSALKSSPPTAGMKWISSKPSNTLNGEQRASGIIILNDINNGYPLVCMEASRISAIRTVVSALVALESFEEQTSLENLGIIGCGYIAQNFLQTSLRIGRKIRNIFLFDNVTDKALNLGNILSQEFPQISITLQSNIENIIRKSKILFFSTTSLTPYIREIDWFNHNPIVLHISLRDIHPLIIKESYNIVDNIDHSLMGETSLHLTHQTYGEGNYICGEIAEFFLGKTLDNKIRPIIFSPMGMGILDIKLAYFIYERAISQNKTYAIKDFF